MKALVPIADGSEEIEAVATIDTFRRAGIDVTVASVSDSKKIAASRGVCLFADCLIGEAGRDFDIIALPGGMPGATHLAGCGQLNDLLLELSSKEKIIGAICAAPAVVLEPTGILKGKRATAHPGFIGQLKSGNAVEERVVTDGNVVTSRGPGTAIEFALAIIRLALGDEKAKQVGDPMLVHIPA